jgi:Lrp/AsnC family transcriptional regulator, regulator for asnA, asnC and gidA
MAAHKRDHAPQAELDHVDKAIIRALQLDGRAPYSKLGPAVGLSQAAVRQRVQRLIEGGVMQVVAVTDPATLGFAVQAMVAVSVSGDVRAVAAIVEQLEEVEYLVITAGRFDLLVEVVCTDTHHLLDVVNDRIRAIPSVSATEVFTYMSLVKQTYSWGVR